MKKERYHIRSRVLKLDVPASYSSRKCTAPKTNKIRKNKMHKKQNSLTCSLPMHSPRPCHSKDGAHQVQQSTAEPETAGHHQHPKHSKNQKLRCKAMDLAHHCKRINNLTLWGMLFDKPIFPWSRHGERQILGTYSSWEKL